MKKSYSHTLFRAHMPLKGRNNWDISMSSISLDKASLTFVVENPSAYSWTNWSYEKLLSYGFRISRPLIFKKRKDETIKMNTEKSERYLRLRWAWRLMTWTRMRLWLWLPERRFSMAHFTAKLLFLSFSTATAVVTLVASAIASSAGGCHIVGPDNLAGLIVGRWCAWCIPGSCIPFFLSS